MPLHIFPGRGILNRNQVSSWQWLTCPNMQKDHIWLWQTFFSPMSQFSGFVVYSPRDQGVTEWSTWLLLSILMQTARGEFHLLRLFCCSISRDSSGHAASNKAVLFALSFLSTHECLSLRDKDHNIPSCKQINDRNKMGRDQMVSVAFSKSCFLYQNDLHLFLVPSPWSDVTRACPFIWHNSLKESPKFYISKDL